VATGHRLDGGASAGRTPRACSAPSRSVPFGTTTSTLPAGATPRQAHRPGRPWPWTVADGRERVSKAHEL
jgi:hypothetical protein